MTIQGTKIRDIKIDPALQKNSINQKFFVSAQIDVSIGNKLDALIEHYNLKSQAALIITMVNDLYENTPISKTILKKYNLL